MGIGLHGMGRRVRPILFFPLLLVVAVFLSSCVTTSHLADKFAQPPPSASVLLVEPDIILFELTAGGLEEPKVEWTEAAKTNVKESLSRLLQEKGDRIIPDKAPADAQDYLETYSQLVKLHEGVGQTVLIHCYMPVYKLPTKEGCFDWKLGESVKALKERTGADYALFVYLRDSYASAGRTGLIVAAAILGIGIQGGMQLGFASLVDLNTSQIIWFNRLFSSVGDLRTPDAAVKAVEKLLSEIPL